MFRSTLFRVLTLAAAFCTAAGPVSAESPASSAGADARRAAGGGTGRPAPANPVIEWASIVQPAIHSAAAPRSGGTSQILHTMMALAVYDAVVAIEGGYRPYAAAIDAPRGADGGVPGRTAPPGRGAPGVARRAVRRVHVSNP